MLNALHDQAPFLNLEQLLQIRQHCQHVHLQSRSRRSGQLTGRQYSRLRGRGVDFDQVRPYLPGDDIRTIDWRVTARSHRVHTKVFNEERERPVFIICEQSSRLLLSSTGLMKSTVAAEACALLAWNALLDNDRIGGMIFAPGECHEIRPRRSRQALLQLLSRLLEANQKLAPATLNDAAIEPVNLALRHGREVVRPGSLVHLVCDHAAIEQLQANLLIPLAAHNDLILLPVHDPLEAELPTAGELAFCDNQQRLLLNSQDATLRDAWRKQFQQRQASWQQLARRLRCNLQLLDTCSHGWQQLDPLLSSQLLRGRR
ncbi:DUF58 domain-containing protein [Halopseudomonas yangmingensis]|uniref:DUF58 domain-containing protein n=1 Tax=Halopseudomonas yangmingensis TaxID=1720063 RepID=A0A1I4SPY7_9GAMM|nr:DUF58 domain-containing protein [Halopseudomonas yangmingensis]SFM66469.1 Protein of unknown function DUF58 [Halopseudomonas yangmingensis]